MATVVVMLFVVIVGGASTVSAQASCRDPLQQPFAADSIWNTPIGSNAQFVDAQFVLPSSGYSFEENIIVMEPTAPLKTMYKAANHGWEGGEAARCTATSEVSYGGHQFPIPNNVSTYDRYEQNTSNSVGAILDVDGRTIYQMQPLSICGFGGDVTRFWEKPTVDLYGPGIEGAHGGSGLSSVGGSIRISEMKAGYRIPHALKLTIFGIENMSRSNGGFRWPATNPDLDNESDPCSGFSNAYCGNVPELRSGALLALPPSVNINSLGLQAESSRMVARALQEYGGYVVDNSGWPNVHISGEFGPAGNGQDVWNTLGGMNEGDLNKIFSQLAVVNNNSPTSIGGGGTPTAPAALPFCDGTNGGGGGGNGGGGNGGGGGTPACATKSQGDADCDTVIDAIDYAIWKLEYLGNYADDRDGDGDVIDADFDGTNGVKLADFNAWVNGFKEFTGGGGGGTGGGGNGGGGGTGAITKPVKILSLGDSITSQAESWTYPLQDLMNADSCVQGADYDFIGHEGSYPPEDIFAQTGSAGYDHERIAHGGFNARGILNVMKNTKIDGSAGGAPAWGAPDVLITYLSVNNQGFGWYDGNYNPSRKGVLEMKQDLKEIVELVRSRNPSVHVILGILQDTGAEHYGESEVRALATEMSTAQSPVTTTDAPNIGGNVKPDGLNIHPNEAGAAIIADVMYEKLKPILDANNICN